MKRIGLMIVLLWLLVLGGVGILGAASPPEAFLKSSRFVGRANPTLVMKSMLYAFQLQNEAELKQLLEDQQNPNSPQYHHWLTPQEFGKRFGVPEQRYQRVIQWLQDNGFTVVQQFPNHLSIYFDGTAAQVERAFGVRMGMYEKAGKQYYSNDRSPQVPKEFQDVTLDVLDLDNFPKDEPLFKSGSTVSMAPADMQTAYNLQPLYSSGFNGSGQTVAIVARSDFLMNDVQLFRSNFGLPANNPQKIFVGTNPGNLGGGEEIEVILDAEWSGAMAPNATIKVVISPTLSISTSYDYIINNIPSAHVISISFGFSELQQASSARTHAISSFAQAAAQGQTVFVSSGDNGAQQPIGGSSLSDGKDINYLCASPNVTCVGGTNINNNFNSSGNFVSYAGEVAWSGSGGGKSSFISKPSYQTGPGVPNDGARDVPDVAALANPSAPGAFLYLHGNIFCCIGGTSLSAPMWGGMFSLVNQFVGGSGVGSANPRIYEMARSQFSGGTVVYHDVTSGNNTTSTVAGFAAGPGYDQVTGWGSPNADSFVRAFGGGSPPPPTAPIIDSLSAMFLADGSLQLTVTGRDSSGNVASLTETRFDVNGVQLGSGTFNITSIVGSQTTFTFNFNVSTGNLLANTRQVQVKLTDANGVDSNTETANVSANGPILDSFSVNFLPNGTTLHFSITGRDAAGNVASLTETRFDVNGVQLGGGTFDITSIVGSQTSFSFTMDITSSSGNIPNTRQVQVKLTDANGVDSNTLTANLSPGAPIIDTLGANILPDGATLSLSIAGRDSAGIVKNLTETRLDSNGQVIGGGTFDITSIVGN
ncbi:MAG: S53 family peptidase [Acidobacteriia bacterium]|nr:S53 family peptidase [Terriglobia bacterium]